GFLATVKLDVPVAEGNISLGVNVHLGQIASASRTLGLDLMPVRNGVDSSGGPLARSATEGSLIDRLLVLADEHDHLGRRSHGDQFPGPRPIEPTGSGCCGLVHA